jgi:hypothetical protein
MLFDLSGYLFLLFEFFVLYMIFEYLRVHHDGSG